MTLYFARMMDKRQKKNRRNGRTSLIPHPLSPHNDSIICVRVNYLRIDSKPTFLRFFLKESTLTTLEQTIADDNRDDRVGYVRHQHNSPTDCFSESSLDQLLNGPFSSNSTKFEPCLYSARGQFIYCLANDNNYDNNGPEKQDVCYSLSRCDFSSLMPEWEICPSLYCHRFSCGATMITVDDKLFVFDQCVVIEKQEDKDEFSQSKPLGFLFDYTSNSWSEVPFFPLDQGSNSFDLIVAPMGKRLLVASKCLRKQFYYDIENSNWIPFEVQGFIDHIWEIRGETVQQLDDNTIVWIDKRGKICGFDSKNSRLFRGCSTVGFGNECDFKNINFCSLVHLRKELFCLVWSDRCDTLLHLSVLYFRFHSDDFIDPLSGDSSHFLISHVKACFRYHLNSPFRLEDAFVL